MLRTFFALLSASGAAFAVDYLIGRAGLRWTQVPKDFPPFTLLPILSGAVGGPLLAAGVYAFIRAVSRQPDRVFLFVAVAALVLSFALPLRLSFTKSKRFAGVTPSAQIVLVLMHTVVAAASVAALLAKPDP